MPEEHLPVYQIQDFNAQEHKERFFYLSSFASHLKEHLFIQKPHKHNFYILLFISKGQGTHTIDFKEYPVQAKTVFFLTPGQVHSWQLSDDTDGYIIFSQRISTGLTSLIRSSTVSLFSRGCTISPCSYFSLRKMMSFCLFSEACNRNMRHKNQWWRMCSAITLIFCSSC